MRDDVKIYALTHKKYHALADEIYVPLQVGSEGKEDLGYLRDDTGENISIENRYFSELTGIYWVLKNAEPAEIMGVCHYRRYPLNESGSIMGAEDYRRILKDCDIITSKEIELPVPYIEGFAADHHSRDLDALREVLKEHFSGYYELFEEIIHDRYTYFGNIMCSSYEVFREYHSWLFEVLFLLKEKIQGHLEDVEYDDYHRRVYGFLSEILLYTWVRKNRLKSFESKIGIIEEKAETRELKERLAELIKKRDIDGAQKAFAEALKVRPDLLMAVSDITGELRLTMEILAAAGLEKEHSGKSIIDDDNDLESLLVYVKKVNAAVKDNDAVQIKELKVSEEMMTAARAVVMRAQT
ncbi:MAG: DUF4422 domain-containing protein [Lachnospiraceae bacterium]|nr:DUF4422 domain-containing protein [Lachnospiraceae bacterium]